MRKSCSRAWLKRVTATGVVSNGVSIKPLALVFCLARSMSLLRAPVMMMAAESLFCVLAVLYAKALEAKASDWAIHKSMLE